MSDADCAEFRLPDFFGVLIDLGAAPEVVLVTGEAVGEVFEKFRDDFGRISSDESVTEHGDNEVVSGQGLQLISHRSSSYRNPVTEGKKDRLRVRS